MESIKIEAGGGAQTSPTIASKEGSSLREDIVMQDTIQADTCSHPFFTATKEQFFEYAEDLNLNLTDELKEHAWELFQIAKQNLRDSVALAQSKDTQAHIDLLWRCAIYLAGRRNITTMDGQTSQMSEVSLTQLLSRSKPAIKLIDFFEPLKYFINALASHGHQAVATCQAVNTATSPRFAEYIAHQKNLQRKFAVVGIAFKKYEALFNSFVAHRSANSGGVIGLDGAAAPATPNGPITAAAAKTPQPMTPGRLSDHHGRAELFGFGWELFLLARARLLGDSYDLVAVLALLTCVVHALLPNASKTAAHARTAGHTLEAVANHTLPFAARPDEPFANRSVTATHQLNDKLVQWLKELCEQKHAETRLVRVLPPGADPATVPLPIGLTAERVIMHNRRVVGRLYEEYYITQGDFDERLFLAAAADDRDKDPFAPSPSPWRSTASRPPPATPASKALSAVAWLARIMDGAADRPSEALTAMCTAVGPSTREIIDRVVSIAQTSYSHEYGNAAERAERVGHAIALYYVLLEDIVNTERCRSAVATASRPELVLLSNEGFHRSLMACCLAVVARVYDPTGPSGATLASALALRQRLAGFGQTAMEYFKVLAVVRERLAGHSMPEAVLGMLGGQEEAILEQLVWEEHSPLYALLDDVAHRGWLEQAVLRTGRPAPANPRPPKVLLLVFQRLLQLVDARVRDVSRALNIRPEVAHEILRAAAVILVRHAPQLMRNVHLYQLLACVIFSVCKVNAVDVLMTDILKAFPKQTRMTILNKLRIPLSAPSQGATETTTHTEMNFIQYYNQVFVPCIGEMITQFKAIGSAPVTPSRMVALSPSRSSGPAPTYFGSNITVSPMSAVRTLHGVGLTVGSSPSRDLIEVNKALANASTQATAPASHTSTPAGRAKKRLFGDVDDTTEPDQPVTKRRRVSTEADMAAPLQADNGAAARPVTRRVSRLHQLVSLANELRKQ